MNRRQVWWWGAAALAGVWLVAAAGIWLVRSQRMTADKAVVYLRQHPLRSVPAGDRQKIVEGMADRVNRLSFEERQRFRYEGRLRQWFEDMTEDERRHYLDLTLPKGLKQMMEAFNAMEPAKRKQVVNRALADLDRHRGEIAPNDVNKAMSDDNVKHLIDQGMKSFYTDASADTKLDLQPLVEQIQSIMQMGR